MPAQTLASTAARRPLVGISAYEIPVDFGQWRDVRATLIPSGYVHSIERAGGRPLLLPPPGEDPDGAAAELLDVLDGLILTGGPDIDPAAYGQEPHPETAGVQALRDAAELALLAGALRRDVPVLGICRGMQLMNVAAGGDLEQHLPDAGVDLALHKQPGRFTCHDVTVEAGTRLAAVVGDGCSVQSSHHQGPGRIGAGLRTSATAPDGTVEGIEDPTRRFAVGVLWHPEEDEPGGASLFQALVAEARAYRMRSAA